MSTAITSKIRGLEISRARSPQKHNQPNPWFPRDSRAGKLH